MQLNDRPSKNNPSGCGYCGGECLRILCTFADSSLRFALERSNKTRQPSEQYPHLWLCGDLLGGVGEQTEVKTHHTRADLESEQRVDVIDSFALQLRLGTFRFTKASKRWT